MKPLYKNDIKLLKLLKNRICGTSISPCTPYKDAIDRVVEWIEDTIKW